MHREKSDYSGIVLRCIVAGSLLIAGMYASVVWYNLYAVRQEEVTSEMAPKQAK